MIQLGLGIRGAQHVARGGFILGLVVSAGIEVAEFIFNDEKTMYDLVGGIGVEAVKTGLAAAVAYGVAALISSVTVIAVAPIGIMAVAIFAAGVGVNWLDNRFGIKQKVIEALKSTGNDVAHGIYEFKKRAESNVSDVIDNIGRDIGREVNRLVDRTIDGAINKIQGNVHNYLCPICRGKY